MNQSHIFAGLLSYLIWGFVPIIFRALTAYEQTEVIAFRFIIAAFILSIVLALKPKEHIENIRSLSKEPKSFQVRTYVLSIFGGLMMSVNTLCYIYVINNISVNAGAFSYLILPIVTAFLGFFLLKEQLNPLKWIGITLGVISCILIGNVSTDQLIYISGVTLSYSFYLVSQRINPFFNRRLLLSIQFFVGAIVLSSVFSVSIFNKPFDFWWKLVVLSAFFSVAPMLLNLFALKKLESSQLAFMIYLNPIASFVLGITLYNEVITLTESIAFLLLGIAIICFNWSLVKRFFPKRLLPKIEKV